VPGKLGLVVQPLKRAKQPLHVGHIKAGAIVAHKKMGRLRFAGGAKFDARRRAPGW